MRQWLVDPKTLCRQHLLGEHLEHHMLVGTIKKGISVNGYIELGLLDPSKLTSRHNELIREMERRGYGHYSPLESVDYTEDGACVDVKGNLVELARRCSECGRLQKEVTKHV